MAIYPLRKLPSLPCAVVAEQWLEKIDADLKAGADRALLCRRTLCEIAYPGMAANWETAVEDLDRLARLDAMAFELTDRGERLVPELSTTPNATTRGFRR